MTGATVAVIGASGLIGSAVVARLARERPVLRVGRHESDHVHLDLRQPGPALAAALDGVTDVVHCAGVTDEDFRSGAAEAWSRATSATATLADLLRRAGVRRLVYVSTAHVYGRLSGPLSERASPDPRTDYALAHFASEQILRRAGFAGAVLRPCAVFGMPPDLGRFRRWGLIPFAFPRMAVESGIIRLATPGRQHRNFVAADTVAEQAARALASGDDFRIVNPSGSDAMTVRDFAQLVAERAREALAIPCRVEAPDGAAGEAPLAYLSETAEPGPPGLLARATTDLLLRLRNEALHEDSRRRRASA